MKTIFLYYKYFKFTVIFTVLQVLFFSCDKFDYSPYEIRLSDDMRDLNKKQINRIYEQYISPADTFSFVVTSDTQGFYAHNEALIEHINQQKGVKFVLHNGDITDFGLLKEHQWIHTSFKKLKVPYVTVIGNHDATGNGKALYQAMYGEFDFSFVAANCKFIFLNTNHWEFDGKVPDLDWLEQQLVGSEQFRQVFVLSHIQPIDGAFGIDKIDRYKELLRKYNVSLSVHGHGHNFQFKKLNEHDVYELHIPSTDKREYVLMRVYGNAYDFKRISF